MACKIFLDTNIIVDYCLASREGHQNAIELIAEVDDFYLQAFISESVVNTTTYLIQKIFSTEEMKRLILDLTSFIRILPCSNAIIEEAYQNAKNDLEDAVLYQIALHGKADYFVTSDIKDFKKFVHPSLPVVSAKRMLEILKS
jgi:predicted nucleic acid-binding protein